MGIYYITRSAAVEETKRRKWQGRLAFALNDEDEECDLFSGSWVPDVTGGHPLYREEECPYIQPQLTCQAPGRPDKAYQLRRWQPHDCTLPAFDARRLLDALRGKRMLFVGDSLGRCQFTSMVCLLQSAIPDLAEKSFDMSPDQQHTTFTAREYNATSCTGSRTAWCGVGPWTTTAGGGAAPTSSSSTRTCGGARACGSACWSAARSTTPRWTWRRASSGCPRTKRTAWRSGRCCSGSGTTWT
jgi:hypothetical protein